MCSLCISQLLFRCLTNNTNIHDGSVCTSSEIKLKWHSLDSQKCVRGRKVSTKSHGRTPEGGGRNAMLVIDGERLGKAAGFPQNPSPRGLAAARSSAPGLRDSLPRQTGLEVPWRAQGARQPRWDDAARWTSTASAWARGRRVGNR